MHLKQTTHTQCESMFLSLDSLVQMKYITVLCIPKAHRNKSQIYIFIELEQLINSIDSSNGIVTTYGIHIPFPAIKLFRTNINSLLNTR